MIKLEDFEKNGFKITWKSLYICFNDSNYSLSPVEIINYATLLLKDQVDKTIACLAACQIDETDYIKQYLEMLSQTENSNYDIEEKKVRLVYVIKNMPNQNIDYITGLIELGNIWSSLDFPKDSPHIFQGRNNTISPNDYYTRDNYNYLYQKHLEWIEKEKKQINNR